MVTLRELPDVDDDSRSGAGGDASELLRELASHRLPAAVLREARAATAEQVALYVMDIDGSRLIRLAGDEPFPDRIPAPLGLGPELPPETLDQVEDIVSSKVPRASVIPLSIRDRAVGILVTCGDSTGRLERLADQAALALELASGYTDVIHRARRRRDINAAAEIQQNLLPPRIAAFAGAEVAGGVLPGYQIGGDFFDYADNDDGLWLAVGDAIGKGNTAAAISSLAVGALRAARRNDATLEQAAEVVHQATFDLGGPYQFVTAVFAVWHPATRTLAWINCGHPPPLLLDPDGTVTPLEGDGTYPLGLFRPQRAFRRTERDVEPGHRILLYSDGVTERRDDTRSQFGTENISRTLRACAHATVAGTVRALQDAVLGFSSRPLRDDATILLVGTDQDR
jgi:serine phosphatase RsbU (regulator of sigma subunit)